jgi:hypothetical protein
VIYDLFTEFGVTAYTEVDFDLDNASPAPGAVKKKCHDIRRKIEDELGVVPYDHIHAIRLGCGRRSARSTRSATGFTISNAAVDCPNLAYSCARLATCSRCWPTAG